MNITKEQILEQIRCHAQKIEEYETLLREMDRPKHGDVYKHKHDNDLWLVTKNGSVICLSEDHFGEEYGVRFSKHIESYEYIGSILEYIS